MPLFIDQKFLRRLHLVQLIWLACTLGFIRNPMTSLRRGHLNGASDQSCNLISERQSIARGKMPFGERFPLRSPSDRHLGLLGDWVYVMKGTREFILIGEQTRVSAGMDHQDF
jgi:hypothetical protein